ncbi:hybrid non-ribosomal peptide synthetase/type I polyketide synthase [Paenibacillus sp. FSL P4-0338]|uniref:hybrid non-ribosomal peptide synthetase/type I polyketide synthase n=1 Tax=unclassified Paenibacillus TaxID=185978 RepID=UPI0003E1D945|nr:hybrid non-ribosomal peptide synthetase/type I polyketide synthase [Paenibacillus sp. FSL R7-269]ETT49793.1 non-ribosomal peptide synthetase/polyketide synthase [Paenibacillus sp. FSL R7-269]
MDNNFGALDIAVIGMDCRFPDAASPEEFWGNLVSGLESVIPISDEELLYSGIRQETLEHPNYVKYGSFIDHYDKFAASFFGYSAKEAAMMDPQHRIFLELCWHALEKSGCDSEQYNGSIGVFAGSTFNSYLLNNVLNGRGAGSSADNFFVQISNDKDNLATRVAYKMNLSGPALSIQTACSTALVAIHYASQSLLNQECDVALAGGVTVRSPHKTGYMYQSDMILSKDGHCRPFDADASGTIFGSGAGVVVLKRLEDAVRDGDIIHAVIKGSSVNNDGGEKVGYTAPGRKGQETVIKTALALADIPQHSITAVEAHGTGTFLGDPVEFESLNQVYGSSHHQQQIALGSVKSNLGHLECAAGVASFIKMVLCLKHKILVPSLNYQTPNPHLQIEKSPFYVNTQVKDWERVEGEPLRCAISSFGIGGTNAHLILEEWTETKNSAASSPELVLLSARSQHALSEMSASMACFLRSNPEVNLGDVAHTLRVGRRAFEYRLAAVGSTASDLAGVLEDYETKNKWIGFIKQTKPRIVFMFPGQGSQYIHMAKELYDSELVFKQLIDQGADLLQEFMKINVLAVLFPSEGEEAEAERLLTLTHITQPVIFLIEYALAKLWMSWGINPDACIGHSIGEYAAACLAGVFTFEQGLMLTAKRGEFICNLPAGSMCGISASEQDITPYLTEKLSVAAVNGPGFTVVSGPENDIRKFMQTIEENGISCSRLHTSHAFHSWMMQPAYEQYLRFMQGITLNQPTIPYLSNVTGDWIEAGQATSHEYWASHIISSVRFSDGADKLLENEESLFIEVGPGNVLSIFMKNIQPTTKVFASLPHAREKSHSVKYIYGSAGKLWTNGAVFHWNEFSEEGTRRKVELPVYPFERRRYWMEPHTHDLDTDFDVVISDSESGLDEQDKVLYSSGQAPRNELEQKTMYAFSAVLGFHSIGIYDSFFELGGHSLLAIQLLSRINEQFGIEIKLNEFYKFPTVEALAQEIGLAISSRADQPSEPAQELWKLNNVIEDVERRADPFPLTEMQEAQWLGRISSFGVGNIAAHVYYESEKEGLDIQRLEQSWQALIDRHEMLRSVLLPDGGQRILTERLTYNIRNLDVRKLDHESAEAEALVVRSQMDHVVRPVTEWPLFEIRTTQLPENKVRIHFSMDLVICDVGSMRILQSEWAQLYRGEALQPAVLDLSFRDYVLAEKQLKDSPPYVKADEFWEQKIKSLPANTAPELPVAKDISSITEIRFKRWSFVVETSRWDQIKEAAVKRALSPSSVILTVFAQVLGLWSKSNEFCINTPIINRLPIHEQVKQIVGEFASFAPVVVSLNKQKTFEECARELQQNSWENLDNRYISGTSILRKLAKLRGGSSGPVFPVVFTSTIVQKVAGEKEFFETLGDYSYLISQTPQVWLDHTAMEMENGLLLSWHALEEMFPQGMLDQMWETYEGIMNRLATDESTWSSTYNQLLREVDLSIVLEANATDQPIDCELLHDPIFRYAKANPNQIALVTSRKEISYGELDKLATAVSCKLMEKQLRRAELVPVIMEKGYEQVVAVLGILQGGGAYLPLDPELPRERLQYILESSAVRVILIQEKYRASLQWIQDLGIAVETITSHNAVSPDKVTRRDSCQELDDLAYVIFTSGSTGMPKGVMITHRAAQNTIMDINAKFQVSSEDIGFALSELNFDLSVYDIFGILGAGGELVIPDAHSSRDPKHWLDMLSLHKVSVWNSVPALMAMLVEYTALLEASLPFRLVLLSGDWIPLNLASRIKKQAALAQVMGLGGATEASIWSNYYPIQEVDPSWRSIPYGKPLSNQKFHVYNKEFVDCPVWVPGDLYISGRGLSLGYLNDVTLTDQAFITHPDTGERLYRTGDMGRYLPDGNLEFMGREDFQVKISGFRIELEEIESVLLKHIAVKGVVVHLAGKDTDKKTLTAYILVKDGMTLDTKELKLFTANALPNYMVPNQYMILDEFPLTVNGKIDRKSLPVPENTGRKSKAQDLSDNKVLNILIPIFAEVLRLAEEKVDIHTNFFTLGGDSIRGIQIISLASKEGIEISPQLFFEHSTLAELAEVLNNSMVELEDGEEQYVGELPLSAGQQLLLERYESLPALNQSLLFKVEKLMEPEKLESAFQYVVSRNAALQMQFNHSDGVWTQALYSKVKKPEIDYVDLNGLEEEEVHKLTEQIRSDQEQQSADILIKLILLDQPDQRLQYILLVWNELIMDQRSVGLFLEQIYDCYNQISAGEKIKQIHRTKQFRDWLNLNREEPAEQSLQDWDDSSVALHLGNPTETSDRMCTLNFTFMKEPVWSAVLEEAKLQDYELLLIAMGYSMQELGYAQQLWVDCMCEAEQKVLVQNEMNHILGQLGSIHSVLFRSDYRSGLSEYIRAGKTTMRNCKKWTEGKPSIHPEIKFTYSEALERLKPGIGVSSAVSLITSTSERAYRSPYLLEISASADQEELLFQIQFNAAQVDDRRMEKLGYSLLQNLQSLFLSIKSEDLDMYVASDYPDMSWSDAEFESFMGILATSH